MYHSRWRSDHYSAGRTYGERLLKNNVEIDFEKYLTDEKIEYGKKVLECYQRFYPEIIEEIRGFADGQKHEFIKVFSFLVTMYVFTYDTYCSMIAFSNEYGIYFGRNSDFKLEIEKLSDSAFYKLKDSFSFIGNTTAMIEMEDGINEKGLACGLTFVYPTVKGVGFNAGFLVRYILEKCETVDDVSEFLQMVPIGSSQNIIAVDKSGRVLSAQLNARHKVIKIDTCDFKTNHFVSTDFKIYHYDGVDDIFSHKRYETLQRQKYSELTIEDVFRLLRGEKGFLCQYNRKDGFDTIWSSVYDIKNGSIYRCEGNPRRKKYRIEKRLLFL